MRILLHEEYVHKFGLDRDPKGRRRELVSCAFYLGYGPLEIESLLNNPARQREVVALIEAAKQLGFTQADLVVWRQRD